MKRTMWIAFIILFISGCETTAEIPALFSAARHQANRNNLPIVLTLWGRSPNAAGGVGVELEFENVNDKTISSILFSITPYNDEGRPVACDVRHGTCSVLKATGPFRPSTQYTRFWENVWYSSAISCLQVDSITVRYLDDTTQMINKPEELNKIIVPYHNKMFLIFNSYYASICEEHTYTAPPNKR
jgi:hypothetical protein